MLELKGRNSTKSVEAKLGTSLLDAALRHKLDWGFSCMRGTCGRCRCLVTDGMAQLTPLTAQELARLETEEIELGYRLGCQAKLAGPDLVKAAAKPYF